jgi:hypothetical protein
MLHFAGRPSILLRHIAIDLAADSKLFQVDTGLNREASPGDDRPLVACFQVIEVGAVAVDLFADRMAGLFRSTLSRTPAA